MKARMRIRNLIDNCHRKAIQWLSSNYQVILLPKYETQNKTKKGKRRIGKKTARSMCTWSHYRFKQRLISKAKQYPDCVVYEGNESYTTVTCGRCGHANPRFTDKAFHCERCHFQTDRDWNGAKLFDQDTWTSFPLKM